MPKWMTVAFALFLSLQVFSTEGRDVDQVINNYIHAMGGRERLNSIHTLRLEASAILKNGVEAKFTYYQQDGKLLKAVVSAGPTQFILAGNQQWISKGNDSLQSGMLVRQAVESIETALELPGLLVSYNSTGYGAELLGRENVNGKECFRIKLTRHRTEEAEYLIDTQSSFIVRQESRSFPSDIKREAAVKLDYSDYHQNKNGYIFAYSLRAFSTLSRLKIREIEVNKPAIF